MCMAGFGLIFNISNMGGNIFLNYTIGAIMDIAAYLLVSYLVNKISRKFFFIGCTTFGAVACILTFLPILLNAPRKVY